MSDERTFTVSFKDQVKDGLIKSEDMIDYLQSILKVKNSKSYAARVVSYKDLTNSISIVSEKGNILKCNMKQYIRRYLRNKGLRQYIKVSGDESDGILLKYINPVEDAEE